MPVVCINGIPYEAADGERLSALLARCGIAAEHPCGGRGTCGKCTVIVNGRAELSCRYVIRGDAEVTMSAPEAIEAAGAAAIAETQPGVGTCDLALDIGTTTLVLAAVERTTGRVLRVVTANNPQRAFGADVMSRIDYARAHGVERLTTAVQVEIDRMIGALWTALGGTNSTDEPVFDRLFVAGNTTMLHLFLGVDPTPMGTAPYTPVFLGERRVSAHACGLHGVGEVVTLPGIAAFVGADLVAGAQVVGEPPAGGYHLLVDLGTNAEILLIARDGILCSAAAAGPCFEGASISCGMSAVPGAICAYDADGGYATIGDAPPRGVCGTGLVDAVAALLDREVIDETGYMEGEVFYLADAVCLTQADVREFQLAKSAVHAAILTLLDEAGATTEDVERLYIAGGFAAKLNIDSAVRVGLLPAELGDRCEAIGNASLIGTAMYAAGPVDLTKLTGRARYVDLAANAQFAEAFMEGMLFE